MDKLTNIEKKLSKSQEKKLKKEKKLLESAFELFMTKGINNTAINDIVKKAGVAKGTFYLYFKDKYDIIDLIILRKSSMILKEGIQKANSKEFSKFEDAVIFLVDYIIEKFKNDKKLLKLIYKNLSWGIYRRVLTRSGQYEEMKIAIMKFLHNMIKNGIEQEEAKKTLFLILELTSSVIYSSIILEEPDTIDNMKPILFKTIRKMLKD